MTSLDGIDLNREAFTKPREQVKFGIIVDGAEGEVEGEQKAWLMISMAGYRPSQKPGL